ncbi:MAG TPA: hypothetical protein VNU25_03410 [Candidatus Paceibacterota bacterium]|nr:hypothetical protein [Candidatus Paceibacterota bacterium]
MRAYIQFFGVRKRTRDMVARQLQASFPGLRIKEVPGCDIAPASIVSIVCRLSELPDGFEPFVSPDGRSIPIEQVPESLRVTIASVLERLCRIVDITKVHSISVSDDGDPDSTQSVAWGPAVKAAVRPNVA